MIMNKKKHGYKTARISEKGETCENGKRARTNEKRQVRTKRTKQNHNWTSMGKNGRERKKIENDHK